MTETTDTDDSDEILHGLRILVADSDSEELSAVVDELVTQLPAPLVETIDSRDDLETLDLTRYDVVVVEPAVTAAPPEQFISWLDGESGETPVVVYTESALASIDEEVFETVDSLVQKDSPVHRRFLVNKIQGIVAATADTGPTYRYEDLEDFGDRSKLAALLVHDDEVVWQSSQASGLVSGGGTSTGNEEPLEDPLERLCPESSPASLRNSDGAVAGRLLEVESDDGQTLSWWSFPLPQDIAARLGGDRLELLRDVTGDLDRREELAPLDTMVERAADGIYTIDARAMLTSVNDAYADLTDSEPERLLGRPAYQNVEEGFLKRGQEAVQKLIESDQDSADTLEMSLRTKDGERVDLEVHFAILPSEAVEYGGLIGVVRDVTERNERERRLRQYRTLVETSPDPMSIVDEEGHIVVCNEAFERLLPDEDPIGAEFDSVAGETWVERRKTARSSLNGETTAASYEVSLHDDSPSTGWFQARLSHIVDDGDVLGTVETLRDVSTRRRRTAELEETNETLAAYATLVSESLSDPLERFERALDGVADGQTEVAGGDVEAPAAVLGELESTVEGLQAMARVEHHQVDTGEFDIAALFERIWNDVAPPAATMQQADELGTITGEEGTIQTAFERLVTVLTGSARGGVTLRVERQNGDRLTLTVAGDIEEPDAIVHHLNNDDIPAATGRVFHLAVVRQALLGHGWHVTAEARDGIVTVEIDTAERQGI